jgi:hypothetical protein
MKKVLVVSHERSGTHFLINTIAFNFNLDWRVINLDNGVQQHFGTQTNKIFKTHYQRYFFDSVWEQLLKEFHVFYIVRDGRDALTSSWFYHKSNHSNPAFPHCNTFSEWLRTNPSKYPYDIYSIEKSCNMVERWKKHVCSWQNIEGVHIITYEELHSNFNVVVDKISTILNVPVNNYQRPSLHGSCSVGSRKGIVSDWKNLFSTEDIEFFNREEI